MSDFDNHLCIYEEIIKVRHALIHAGTMQPRGGSQSEAIFNTALLYFPLPMAP